MLSIIICDLSDFIEKQIYVVKFYWLEQNREVHIFPHNFKCLNEEDAYENYKYKFDFMSFIDGNYEIEVHFRNNVSSYCTNTGTGTGTCTDINKKSCTLEIQQINNVGSNEIHKIVTCVKNKESVYFHSIPYISMFGINDQNIFKTSSSHKIKWYTDSSKFVGYKKLLKKQIYYSDKLFWNVYWYQLHILSIEYPENPTDDDKHEISKLIRIMKQDGIPCNMCRQHFILWLQLNPGNFHLESKNKLIRFFFELHNDINNKNQKHIFTEKEFNAKYVHPLGKVFVERDIKYYGIDIVDLFKKRKLETFCHSYITDGNKKIREYVKTIPNFDTMIL